MSKLSIVSSSQMARILRHLGFVLVRQKGSHVFMARESPFAAVSVPLHREIAPGTLRDILNSVGLSVEQFRGLLRGK